MSHVVDPSRPAPAAGSGGRQPRRRPWWVAALLGLLVLGLLLVALAQCGRDDAAGPDATDQATGQVDADPGTGSGAPGDGGDEGQAGTGQSGVDADPGAGSGAPGDAQDEAATGTAPAAAPSVAPGGAAAGSAGGGAVGGALTAGGADLLADPAALARVEGQPATAAGVAVESVPSDEGFWVGSSPSQRVWVQLSGTGESPFQVVAGQRVSFSGTVTPSEPGFAEQVGVDAAEGAQQLTQQGRHIAVDRASLRLEQQS